MLVARTVFGAALVVLVISAGLYVVFKDRAPSSTTDNPTYPTSGVLLTSGNGEMIDLGSLTADLTVFYFWATWSPRSDEDLRFLNALQNKYGSRVLFVAVNRDAVREEGTRYLRERDVGESLLYLYDEEDVYYRELGGYNMPELVFLGRNGEVYHHQHGPMTHEDIENRIRALNPS